MKQIYYSFSLVFFALSAFSCYDDQGNNKYHEIGEISIAGMEKKYDVVTFRDVLNIDPLVASTDPNDVFDYYWTLDKKRIIDEDESKIKLDTISLEKNLNYPVELKQGFYNLTLYVTNRSTGFQMNQVVDLNVTTPFSRGFYVLKEMEGHTEIDLHLSNDEKMENLLTTANDGPVRGKPVSMGMNFTYYYLNETSPDFQKANTLNVLTEEDGRIVKVEDMSTVFTYRSMYYGEPPVNEKPYYMFSYGFGIGYASSEGFYCNIQWGESSGGYGYPQVVDGGCSVDRNVVTDGMSAFFYDTKNRRFLNCDWNGEIHIYSDLGKDNETKEFTPNHIPHQLIYFGRCMVADGGYAIFCDANDHSKRYLYSLVLDPHSDANPIKTVTVVDPDLKLNKAEMFATNELDANVIYSVVDNRIYAYDVTQQEEIEIKPDGFTAGEEITCISYRYWTQDNDVDYSFKHLVITTYKDGKYKVYMYDLVGSQTYGAPKYLFQGNGKVVKVQYASPKMEGGLVSAPNYSMSF